MSGPGDARDEGRRQIQPLRAIVDRAIDTVRPRAEAKQVRLEVDCAETGLDVACERERLVQVLDHLLDNAVKFSPAGAAVSLRAVSVGKEARVTVADTGPGIAADVRAALFLGSRLGATKRSIEALGGHIWVESELGAGARFSFTLPRGTLERTVLVVEDDAMTRETLSEALRQEGYHVSSARNGADALTYLRRLPTTSVVLLDLQMPVLDGWGFLSQRDSDPQLRAIPVVIISGQPEDEDRIASARVSFVAKPLRMNELLQALERAPGG